jgi:hypothetical protein
MKKILFGLTIVATAFGACKQKSNLNTDRSMVLLSDSGNYNYNGSSDTGYNNQQVVSSGIFGAGTTNAVSHAEPAVNEPIRATSAKSSSSNTRATTRRTSTSSGSGTSSSGGTTASTVPARKKGWSKAAKGAAIGGGAGAVAGAVIGKNAKGAIIGAVLGAGGGYIIGRSQDKKDGRY